MSAEHKWVKGVSGNPSGLRKDGQPRAKRKPKPPNGLSRKEMVELCSSHSKEMVERLLFWARSKNARMSVRAAQLIIERAHGAPPTREETRLILDGGKGEDKIEVVFVTPQPQPDDDLDYSRRVVH
jgi:hypothetical protein